MKINHYMWIAVLLGSGAASFHSQATQTQAEATHAPVGAAAGAQAIPAQEPVITHWRDALEAAYAFNPMLKEAQAAVRIAQEGRKRIYGEWVPHVTGTMSAGMSNQDPKGVAGSSRSNTRHAGVQASQNIFASGGTVARTRQANAALEEAKMNLMAKESAVFYEVLQAYFTILVAQKSLEVYERNQELSQSLLEQTRARFEVGEVTQTDVSVGESNLAAADAKLVEGRANLIIAQGKFAQLVGAPAGEALVWRDLDLEIPGTFDAFLNQAQHNNFELRAAALQEKAAGHNVTSQLADHMLPSVHLKGGVGYDLDRNKNTLPGQLPKSRRESASYSAMLEFRAPIGLGREQTFVREAEQRRTLASLGRKQRALALRQSVLEAWNTRLAAEKSVHQFTLEEAANKQAFHAMREEYALGGRTLVNLATVQQKWVESSVSLLEAKRQFILKTARLHLLNAGLTAHSLQLNVALYNPDDYSPWFGVNVEAPVT